MFTELLPVELEHEFEEGPAITVIAVKAGKGCGGASSTPVDGETKAMVPVTRDFEDFEDLEDFKAVRALEGRTRIPDPGA